LDINAGSFHVILTNMLGLAKKGMVCDRDRSIQVWNQPVLGYSVELTGVSRNASENAAVGTTKEIQVNTKMMYTVESKPHWNAIDPIITGSIYNYWLELDNNETILGGSFDSYDRTDFLWMINGMNSFDGYFASLSTIYSAATNSASIATTTRRSRKETEIILTGQSGYIRLPEENSNYNNQQYKEWLIVPEGFPTYIELQFQHFSTERYRDKVKIYEGIDGKGPLIAVFHGQQKPTSLIIRSPGVKIVFESDESVVDTGFVVRYSGGYY